MAKSQWRRGAGGVSSGGAGIAAEVFAFAVAQKKSPFIKVVLGLTKYFNGDVAPELKGKVIAHMGDRTEVAEPFIFVLPEKAS
jgi:hypothetical protein